MPSSAPPTTEISPLSLHDALPISAHAGPCHQRHLFPRRKGISGAKFFAQQTRRSEEHTSELQSQSNLVCRLLLRRPPRSPLFPYTTRFRSPRMPVHATSATSFQGGKGSRARSFLLSKRGDRKSTRLNSSHSQTSYAVFCSADHRDLPSFPTRRASDLRACRSMPPAPPLSKEERDLGREVFCSANA